MSDDDVINYVRTETERGTDSQTVIKNLLAQGVSTEQLQRLRARYRSGQGESGLGKVGQASGNGLRMRIDNGQPPASPGGAAPRMSDAGNFGDSLSLLLSGKDDLADWASADKVKSRIFGHDLFRNPDIRFESIVNVGTPDSYVLGAGDQVYIDVYGASQQTFDCTVSPDGRILVPDYGPIQVAGMTVAQALARVRAKLGAYYESSDISLTLGQSRTISVHVMGEVSVPGTYHLSGFATIFNALYAAGGVSEIGTLREVGLFRSGRRVCSADIYEYIMDGKLSGDIRLQDGDAVVVGPYKQLVQVEGLVKRPMYYELRQGETLERALTFAGGLRGDAYRQTVRVIRPNGRDLQVHNVEPAHFAAFTLSDGDLVSVAGLAEDRMSNTVEVRGAVFRPGYYQLGGSVSTVGELVRMADGTLEDAFASHAVMHRRRPDRTLEAMAVDVAGILGGYVPDVPLRDEDVLYIPSLRQRNEERTLSVYGEVYNPGLYPYAANTTLEDIILQAGGLRDNASTVKVDVARRIVNPTALRDTAQRSEVFTFSLREGFVIDGTPGFTLEPFDQVYVHQSPVYNVQTRVEVVGEVLFAGSYTLSESDERLSAVVQAAGGLSSRAYAKGARLQRTMTADERLRRAQLLNMVKGSAVDSVDMSKLEVGSTYYVGIDLERALRNPGSNDDIVMREGDRLIIPQINSTVSVNGEVLYPNTVSYEQGQRAHYYINQAGGYSTEARKRQSYVIYQSGKVAKVRKGAKIQPGCEIVVPTKKQRPNGLQTTTQWVAISSSIATVAAVVISVVK